jgi:hypothetical protein
MQFRDNWGFEINFNMGKSKDEDKKFDSYEISLSSWFNTSPNYSANLWGGYSKTYNFSRDYLAFYSWLGSEFNFKATDILDIGTSFNMWVEGNPNGNIADITYNARPYFSFTPINDLNLRVYVDNVYLRSSKQLEHVILGVLFSYQFLPKSWIYFAYNDYQNRDSIDRTFRVANRASVLKVKYLYYF